jgi:excisionase family DNA binding protein
MSKISFDDLPTAVSHLHKKLDKIEFLIKEANIKSKKTEQDIPIFVPEAAKFLGVAIPTIYSKSSKGEIPSLKKGKRLYFLKSDLLKYLEEGRRKTNSEISNKAADFIISKTNSNEK